MKGLRRPYLWALVVVIVAIAGAGIFMLRPQRVDAKELAASIVKDCKGNDAERCYEREVPALYPQHPFPQIFDVIREIRREDPTYQFCHVLAHKLGEEAVAEDPSRWLDLIPLNPTDNLCSNGFVHGIIVGRFRNDVLDKETLVKAMPDFERACEPRGSWHPSGVEQAMCYHALGHLFDFITNADTKMALEACKQVGSSPTGNFMRVCREGVFMQFYQPLEPDDFALVDLLPSKLTATTYRSFCATFSDSGEVGACLREAWPLFRQGVIDGTGVKSFCSGHPKEEEQSCFETAAAIIGRMSLGDSDKAAQACDQFPKDRQGLCYVTTAQTVIEENRSDGGRAIALCNKGSSENASFCLQTLAQRAASIYRQGSPMLSQFCRLFPPDLQAKCRGDFRKND